MWLTPLSGQAGHGRKKIELKDSECYAHLMNQLTSAMPDEEFPYVN